MRSILVIMMMLIMMRSSARRGNSFTFSLLFVNNHWKEACFLRFFDLRNLNIIYIFYFSIHY